MDRFREHRVGREGVLHYKYDGTYIGSNAFPLAMSRAVLHDTLNQYVRGLGIEVKFSTRVVDYFETDDHAGVTLDDGSKLCADVVVASDGVGSKSWSLVSGYKEKPVSSGYALFRATYPVGLALDKPHIAEEYGNVQDKCKLFAGDGAHIIIARAGPNMIFMLTHKLRLHDPSQFALLLADTDYLSQRIPAPPRKSGQSRHPSTTPCHMLRAGVPK